MTTNFEGAPDRTLTYAKPLADDEVLRHFRRRVEDAADHCKEIWERAEENERFTYGGKEQWDPADYETRTGQKRPTLSMNDIVLAVNAVAGRQFTQRHQPAFLGRAGMDDEGWAEAISEFSRKIRDRNHYEQVISHTFRKLHIQNYAWTEREQDFTRRPLGVGQTVERVVRIWEMIWPREAQEWNLMDREWDARGRMVSFEEAISRFPQRESEIKEAKDDRRLWVDPKEEKTHRWPWLYVGKGNQWVLNHREEVFLVDYHWRQRAFWYLIPGGVPEGFPELDDIQALWNEGALRGLEPEEFFSWMDKLAAQLEVEDPKLRPPLELSTPQFAAHSAVWEEAFGAQIEANGYAPIPVWEFWRAWILGDKVLSSHRFPFDRFPRVCMTGFPFEQAEKTTHFGIVDLMKDPQCFKNLILSATVSLLQHSPKGPLLAEEGAFKKPTEVASQLTRPGAIVTLKAGGAQKIDWGPTPSYMPGLEHLVATADTAVWRPIGLSPQTLGQIPDLRRISGEVFNRVQDAVSMILSYPFDSLRLANKEWGRLDLDFMIAYHEHKDVVRIIGEAKAFGPPPEPQPQIDPETGQPMLDPQTGQPMLIEQPYPPEDPSTWLLPPRDRWEEMAEFDVIVEERPASQSEMRETWDYFTRTGMLDSWVQSGLIPVDIVVDWIPILTEGQRRRWLKHLESMKDQESEEPPPEQEEAE